LGAGNVPCPFYQWHRTSGSEQEFLLGDHKWMTEWMGEWKKWLLTALSPLRDLNFRLCPLFLASPSN
jgi:hypothetical protein